MANNLLKKNDVLGEKQKRKKEQKKKLENKVSKKTIIISVLLSVVFLIAGILILVKLPEKEDKNSPSDISDEGEVKIEEDTAKEVGEVELTNITKSDIDITVKIADKTYTNKLSVEKKQADGVFEEYISGTKNGIDINYGFLSDETSSCWYELKDGEYVVYNDSLVQDLIDIPSILNNINRYSSDGMISNQLIMEILPDDYLYYTYKVPYTLTKTDEGYTLEISGKDIAASNIEDETDTIKIDELSLNISIKNIDDFSGSIITK